MAFEVKGSKLLSKTFLVAEKKVFEERDGIKNVLRRPKQ